MANIAKPVEIMARRLTLEVTVASWQFVFVIILSPKTFKSDCYDFESSGIFFNHRAPKEHREIIELFKLIQKGRIITNLGL
jgi:hypothetical protein